ncbi:MAG: HEPN domain-containing protein [Cytophagales bacterium]|nr:HEPN domain-containing protein [Cytophagales bacterium]
MTPEEQKSVVVYRIDKAHSELKEIQYLIDGACWNTATNRLYYACYYAVSVLLIKNGHRVSSHSVAISLFGEHFIKTEILSKKANRIYSELFQKRLSGDYADFFDNTEEFVLGIKPKAQELIHQITQIIEKN